MNLKRDQDRRSYPRLNLPLYCRTARPDALRQKVIDTSLGGIRVYSDERHRLAEKLELELYLPEGTRYGCSAMVVWCHPAPEEQDARFELGLKFLELPDETLTVLKSHLLQEA